MILESMLKHGFREKKGPFATARGIWGFVERCVPLGSFLYLNCLLAAAKGLPLHARLPFVECVSSPTFARRQGAPEPGCAPQSCRFAAGLIPGHHAQKLLAELLKDCLAREGVLAEW